MRTASPAPAARPEHGAERPRARPPGRGRTARAGRGSRRLLAAGPARGSARSTVIESVLKMRNAPTKSATAAISAVIARKSAVDERSDAARSRGRRQHVRLGRQRDLERRADLGRGGALADDDVDAADAVEREQPLRRPERDDDRPAAGADERAVAGQDPLDRERDRAVGAALERDVRADREPFLGGEPLGDERPERLRPGEALARGERQVADLRLGGGVDAEHRDGLLEAVGRRSVGDEVRPSLEDRGRDDDPRRLVDRGHALRGEALVAERGHPQIRPADDVVDGPVDRGLDPGVGRERGEQDADARARSRRPTAASGRGGRRGCGATRDVRPRIGSEAQLGEAA